MASVKISILLAIALIMNPAESNEKISWHLLNRDSGCGPIEDLYEDYPCLKHLNSPQEIAGALKIKYADVKIISVVDVIDNERKKKVIRQLKMKLNFSSILTN